MQKPYWPSVMVLTLFFVAVAVIVFLPAPSTLKWPLIAAVVVFHFFAANRG
jgi:hypothetical protein